MHIRKVTITLVALYDADEYPDKAFQYSIDLVSFAEAMDTGLLAGRAQLTAIENIPAEHVANELQAIGNDRDFFAKPRRR
jgi:hypothetical protein